MRVNLISNHRPGTGVSQDVNIMRGILTAMFEDNVQLSLVQYIQPQCNEADINIFIDTVNPSLFSYAARNIWIPNPEMTPNTWEPYLHMVNEIWTKTTEATELFKKLTPTTVKYIGWTSLNKQTPSKKNYYKALVPLGSNFNREIIPLIHAIQQLKYKNNAVYAKLPMFHVVYNPQRHTVNIPPEVSDHFVLHTPLKDNEYDELLNDCGLCVCLSKAEGFGHAVNEAMASGCNLIVSSIAPFMQDTVGEGNHGAFFVNPELVVNNTNCYGSLVRSDVNSLIEILEEYTDLTFQQRKFGSEFMRGVYEQNHQRWMKRMKEVISSEFIIDEPYSLKDSMPKEEDLPDVSIVCVTRDRRVFMPILKYCYMIQSYPEEKMELVIVDDGDDSIEDTLFGIPNVTYVRLDEKKTIGEKRNIGVSKAMYDVIAFMDDDDVYPNNSILERVAMMLKTPSKECAFCSVIPCYDIVKYCSFMNAPPLHLPMSQRLSEATLVFTRKFWEDRNFGDTQIAEGEAFIHGREHMCRELSPQEVIVSLVHPKNTSSRKVPEFKEPNGCHFGFNEKLFAMVSEIGQALKESA
jgi:hypothetical protein